MPISVSGQCDPKFAEVQAQFERKLFRQRWIWCLSLSQCEWWDYGGFMGRAGQSRNGSALGARHSIYCVFSCTKAATALCAHILIDRGTVRFECPGHRLLAWLWQNTASINTTVAMMLNHESGCARISWADKPGGFFDWDYMISRLENEAPFWEPGTRNGYHMLSFGWTVGELSTKSLWPNP